LGAEKLLVNGDIGNRQETLKQSQAFVGFILDSIGKSGLESFVQPGSHETLLAFGPVLDYFSGKYGNIIDATKHPKSEQDGHDLVFLPGSDWSCGGEYMLGNLPNVPSGRYIKNEKGLVRFEEFKQYIGALQQGISKGAMQYTSMQDLENLVTAPEKTVVVCHVPRRFDNPNCVDVAEFGKPFEDVQQWEVEFAGGKTGTIYSRNLHTEQLTSFWKANNVRKVISGDVISESTILTSDKTKEILSQDPLLPFAIERENRGNLDLARLYEKIGITKAVNGHFHESSHRANNRAGNHVQEGEQVKELFWNSGHLDVGHTGILTIEGDKASYRNVCLQDYLQ